MQSAVAGAGIVAGLFIVVYGATPGQAVADGLAHPPPWATHHVFKLALVMVGLVVIGASLRFNVWSQRQRAVDGLADEISWALSNLLHRQVADEGALQRWETDYGAGAPASIRN